MSDDEPCELTPAAALKLVREIATDTNSIVLIPHSQKRLAQRRYSRRQVEMCIQRGSLTEGPFKNAKGNWQLNLWRSAAGEEMTCVVAIEWPKKLIVVTVI